VKGRRRRSWGWWLGTPVARKRASRVSNSGVDQRTDQALRCAPVGTKNAQDSALWCDATVRRSEGQQERQQQQGDRRLEGLMYVIAADCGPRAAERAAKNQGVPVLAWPLPVPARHQNPNLFFAGSRWDASVNRLSPSSPSRSFAPPHLSTCKRQSSLCRSACKCCTDAGRDRRWSAAACLAGVICAG